MADSSLSFTDTSSSGGVQAIAVAACNMQRDGADDIEIDDGADHEATNYEYNFLSRQLNSSNSANSANFLWLPQWELPRVPQGQSF